MTRRLDDGIVVVEVRKRGCMGVSGYPSPLRERLGDAGVAELSRVLSVQKDEIVTVVEGRFERRLADECGKLRAQLRGEMQELRGELRGEMIALRAELHSDLKMLRAEVVAQHGTLKADLIKWSFLFWVGQAAVVMGFMSAFHSLFTHS